MHLEFHEHISWEKTGSRLVWLLQNLRRNKKFSVAERPRDALCLSVVSFNSTKRRAESFIATLRRLQIYHCVQLNAVLLSLA